MLFGTAFLSCVISISTPMAAGPDTPGVAAEAEITFDISKGKYLAKLVKVGMTEDDISVIFGRDHRPLRIKFGTVSDTTLLAYPEYGVTIVIGIDGKVTDVLRRGEKDRPPAPPAPIADKRKTGIISF